MGNSGIAVSKITAKAASIGIDAAAMAFLQDAFKQFGVQVVSLSGNPIDLFSKQKFEACVLKLYDPDAEKILTAIRNSASNRRMVIYGIARNTPEALRFSSYGINAVMDEPLDRQSVLKVVRATHLLVVHELRRYVRIPVVTELMIEMGSRTLNAMTVEISGGGMSVRTETALTSADVARLTFNLPGSKKVTIRAHLCWSRTAENLYGFRFDPTDEARIKVRSWIDQYLEIM